jgi:peptidoglycan/LPS O-acetylase OafA/YrhL
MIASTAIAMGDSLPPSNVTGRLDVARTTEAPGYLPELDGVRGLAIILVILTHWQNAWESSSAIDVVVHQIASPGWLGVELFFVLSGFLITRLLLFRRETSSGLAPYLRSFMWRRALRIFPLYYATLLLIFAVVPRIIPIHDPAYQTLRHNAPWYWLYSVNWLDALHGSSQITMNTGHFWSLAVEEQFYLLWPIVVWCAGHKRLPYVCMTLWAASLIGRFAVGEAFDPHRVTPVLHFDPLMAGALVAWYSTGVTRIRAERWLPAIATVGSLAIFGWLVTGGQRILWLPAVAFSALVGCLVLGRGGASLSRAFRSPTLRVFGKYSYCIYVVHYLILEGIPRLMPRLAVPRLLGSSLPSALVMGALLVGSSFFVAMVSWRALERPMLRLKDFRWPTVGATPTPVVDG